MSWVDAVWPEPEERCLGVDVVGDIDGVRGRDVGEAARPASDRHDESGAVTTGGEVGVAPGAVEDEDL